MKIICCIDSTLESSSTVMVMDTLIHLLTGVKPWEPYLKDKELTEDITEHEIIFLSVIRSYQSVTPSNLVDTFFTPIEEYQTRKEHTEFDAQIFFKTYIMERCETFRISGVRQEILHADLIGLALEEYIAKEQPDLVIVGSREMKPRSITKHVVRNCTNAASLLLAKGCGFCHRKECLCAEEKKQRMRERLIEKEKKERREKELVKKQRKEYKQYMNEVKAIQKEQARQEALEKKREKEMAKQSDQPS